MEDCSWGRTWNGSLYNVVPIYVPSCGRVTELTITCKVSLTVCAPIKRQIETSTIIPLNTASASPTPVSTVTDTNRNVRSALWNIAEKSNLKSRNNF